MFKSNFCWFKWRSHFVRVWWCNFCILFSFFRSFFSFAHPFSLFVLINVVNGKVSNWIHIKMRVTLDSVSKTFQIAVHCTPFPLIFVVRKSDCCCCYSFFFSLSLSMLPFFVFKWLTSYYVFLICQPLLKCACVRC